MKDRPKKCCKCGDVVCLITLQNTGRMAKTVKPYAIRAGKYWCKECADKEDNK